MANNRADGKDFNIVIVAQAGRLQYEAVLFAASLRHSAPDFRGRLLVAVPQPGPRWHGDPSIRQADVLDALARLKAEIVPFDNTVFGQSYPYGNKIEALAALPEGEPFVFFDTDTLITGDITKVPFDFDQPSASLRREGTWPKIELYGPDYTATWKSLYDLFDLDFDSSLNPRWPDEFWRRYLYFNAGFFYYRCPHEFGTRFLEYAVEIRDNPPKELVCQSLDPWLDQVALPLVIHSFGGKRDALPKGKMDEEITCHYRMFPLLFAKESDRVVEVLESVAKDKALKPILKQYDPIKFMVYHGRGHKVRAMFDRENLPRKEKAIRNKIRKAGFWMR